jgi:calcineurin-like phosphoesterase
MHWFGSLFLHACIFPIDFCHSSHLISSVSVHFSMHCVLCCLCFALTVHTYIYIHTHTPTHTHTHTYTYIHTYIYTNTQTCADFTSVIGEHLTEPIFSFLSLFVGAFLAYQEGKDIVVFRFIIEYSS